MENRNTELSFSANHEQSDISSMQEVSLPEIGENNKGRYSGNIERFEQSYLSGWIRDESPDAEPVSFSVYTNNVLLAAGVADEFRQDLLDYGIGNGVHGFTIKLDDYVLDGEMHEIHVTVEENGYVIGSHMLSAEHFATSEITDVNAGNINGKIFLANENAASGFDIEILSDGNVCAVGVCSLDESSGSYSYSVKLPTSLFDDRFHVYGARLKFLSTKIKLFEEKIPSIITSWQFLSDDISTGTISTLPKVAGYRYKAMQSQLRLIADNAIDSAGAGNVFTAHQVLVEGYENRKKFPKLVLPRVESPLVSVIIPVHNKFSLTYNCIASLILASNKASFEVIVVDDLSSDETTDLNLYIENAHVVCNETNKGFLRSCRAGVEASKGEYIIFLNNDTEVTDLWLDELLQVFSNIDNVGIVGSKLIYPNGDLQEAGGVVWGNGKPWNYGNGGNAEHPKFNYVRQVDYVSGAALMISKHAWDEVGGFSESYAPAYYEDVDLCFKVRDEGMKVVYSPASVVVHFEGMSNGRDLDIGIKKFQAINGPRFRKTWRRSYRNNGKEAVAVDLQKDRNIDFRVLFVDCTVPRPDQDAGGYAAAQEIKILQELGCKVTFLPNNMAHLGKHTRTLQDDGVECIYAPFYSSIGEFLVDRGMEFDFVYIIRYDIAEEILPYIKQYTRAKVVLNNCDLHFLREIRAALVSGNSSMEGPVNTRERELSVMRRVDALLSYNEVEHSVIASHNLAEENIFKCPWVLTPKPSEPTFEERNGIAFLGGFNHTPNLEAITYFVNSVMPDLRKRIPGIKLRIYGSRMTKEVEDLACEDVLVIGYAETLSMVFDECRVFIAPLLSGAGIKGKVLESMAYAVPSVLSPVAAEATGLVHGTSALIATSTEQWSEHIERLYSDQELWGNISKASHDLVSSRYSFDNALSEMSKLLEYLELDPADERSNYYKLAS